MLGGGGDGPEPAAKRAKVVSVAGLSAEAAEFLRTETLHLTAASGVLLGAESDDISKFSAGAQTDNNIREHQFWLSSSTPLFF